MARHGLLAPLASIPDACAAMCGAHAQIMSAAEVSIGLRVDGVTRSDVARALWDERSIVKTFGSRGTVHLLPAADLARWCAALSRVPRHNSHPEGVRLDDAQTGEIVAAIEAALADGELTVDELDREVARRCGAWAAEESMAAFGGYWPRWRQAIGAAASAGVLCFGPNRGRKVTYTNPKRWLAAFTVAADATLVPDYLHSYGPAAPEHFAQWQAAATTWARPQFAHVSEIELAGSRAWVNRGDHEFTDDPAAVRLLPYFDAFGVGSHPRGLLFPGRAAQRALAGSQAGNFPLLLLDGTVGGVWHHRRAGKKIAITVEPLRTLTARQRQALHDETERIGFILEGRVEVTIGKVTVGPHA